MNTFIISKIINEKLNSGDCLNDYASIIDQLLLNLNNQSAEAIALFILNKPESAAFPQWMKLLVQSKKADLRLDHETLQMPHWLNHPDLVKLIKDKKMNAKNLRKYYK